MSLAQCALAHASPRLREQLSRIADLDDRLRRLFDAAQQRHPDVRIADEDFIRYVVERLDPEKPDADLARLVVDDLYVACAAVRGDPAAIGWIDASVLPDVRIALEAMSLPAATIDELLQRVRHSLFVAEPGTLPKLASYAGRSRLRRWVRSTAVRKALNLNRERNEVSLEQVLLGELERPTLHPVEDLIKTRYRQELARSLSDALRSLSPRERTALRLHHIDGVTLDQLAVRYGVHRATVARWLATSRELLVTRTLAGIKSRFRIDGGEAESLLRLVISRLELTLDHDATDDES